MPELPEVEEVRRSLEPALLGIPIIAISVLRPDFVTPLQAPLTNLLHHVITRTHRHGKYFFLIADDDQTLHIHLGMTGHVDLHSPADPLAKHTHVTFTLANNRQIRLHDPRRFGGLWYHPTFAAALQNHTARLGPDALTLTPAHLAHWKRTKGTLKQRLLAQRDVAGLGNIYVDEALFLSKLHPLQRVSRLKPAQLDALVQAVHTVLNNSLRSGGTTLRDYRNASNQPGQFARQLKAYGRAGLPCLSCTTTLKSITITARTTVFCPTCQRRH